MFEWMNEWMNEVIQDCVWVYVCVFHFHLPLCVPKEGDKKRKREKKKSIAAAAAVRLCTLSEACILKCFCVNLCVCVCACECPYLLNEPSRSMLALTDTCDLATSLQTPLTSQHLKRPVSKITVGERQTKWSADVTDLIAFAELIFWFETNVSRPFPQKTVWHVTRESTNMNNGWTWFGCYSFRLSCIAARALLGRWNRAIDIV